MNLFNADLPRTALVIDVFIAALAAVGLTILVGAQTYAVVGVPLLTALLTFALLTTAARAGIGPHRKEGDGLTDPLTGLATEAVADHVLAREFAAAQRGRLLTVVLFRLKGLPGYRARHGETATAELLRAAGRTLARHRRRMHLAAPYGPRPGTFLSILSDSDREGAEIYAARARDDLMKSKGGPSHEGVSVGIASFELSMTSPEELIRKATFALEGGPKAGGKIMVVGGRMAG